MLPHGRFSTRWRPRWLLSVAAGLAALLAGVVGLQRARERLGPLPLPDGGGSVLYVRSPEVMKRAVLSYDAVAADLYWIRAIQHYGATKLSTDPRKAYDQLGRHNPGEQFRPPPGWEQYAQGAGFGNSHGGAGGFGGGAPEMAPGPAAAPVDATVKWFKADKGFGFVTPDDGQKDVFIHKTCLSRYNLHDLQAGLRLAMKVIAAPKGREVLDFQIIAH
mgnify:CR=1 FL=1